MQRTITLRQAASEVGLAVRKPEQLAVRWSDGEPLALRSLLAVLLANAFFGMAVYGLTMQLHNGSLAMLEAALLAPAAAGGAWLIALPALYIFNNALGSRLRPGATLLAASITVCFGAWAMLASVPINWFFSVALPYDGVRLLINLVIFAGVGLCMTDVFIRVLKALEPERSSFYGYLWIGLVGLIGMELFTILGVFNF